MLPQQFTSAADVLNNEGGGFRKRSRKGNTSAADMFNNEGGGSAAPSAKASANA